MITIYREKEIIMILTGILVGINVLVFLVLSFGGRTEDAVYMVEHGAMFAPYIEEYGEYYRLFTSMFLHFGINHLVNNMITLCLMGKYVEPIVGKIRFLLIYFVSGVCGSLLSFAGDMYMEDYAVSAGASGAIFGLTGALLALTIIHKGRVKDVTRRGILFIIAINLYIGITGQGVDNLAHIGGLLAGFILTLLVADRPKKLFHNVEEILQ